MLNLDCVWLIASHSKTRAAFETVVAGLTGFTLNHARKLANKMYRTRRVRDRSYRYRIFDQPRDVPFARGLQLPPHRKEQVSLIGGAQARLETRIVNAHRGHNHYVQMQSIVYETMKKYWLPDINKETMRFLRNGHTLVFRIDNKIRKIVKVQVVLETSSIVLLYRPNEVRAYTSL